MKNYIGSTDFERKFLKIFRSLCGSRSSWQVWQDFVDMSACAIANSVDKQEDVWKKREDEYMRIVKGYRKEEANDIAELLGIVVSALDENPDQDFLGKLYMQLNLGSHWHGQFFTPWHVSELMAKIIVGDESKKQIEKNRYISVVDPCCGAGGMLLAFASACREKTTDINYQQSVLFVGQDIDPVVAKMCFIQMSLIGCPGYVIIGDALIKPPKGTLLQPIYDPPENIWFTPLYFTDVWAWRRIKEQMDYMMTPTEKQSNKTETMPSKHVEKPTVIIPKTEIKEKKPFSWKEFFTVKKKEKVGCLKEMRMKDR